MGSGLSSGCFCGGEAGGFGGDGAATEIRGGTGLAEGPTPIAFENGGGFGVGGNFIGVDEKNGASLYEVDERSIGTER